MAVAPDSPPEGACPVCGARPARPLLRASGVPVHQNVFAATRAAALSVTRGTLAFVRCAACGLTYNAAFDPSLLRYDAAYEVDQSRSPRFLAHLDAVCARVAARTTGVVDLVEIGCGQGTFLAQLARNLGPRLRCAVGFDPAFRGELSFPPEVRVLPRTFDAAAIARECPRPALVVLRHILEHVPDPVAFLRELRACFPDTPFDLCVETPDADHPLRNGIVHDLYYEHCSLHSAEALGRAMVSAGFSGLAIDRVFDDEYLLTFGRADPGRAAGAPGAGWIPPLANAATDADVASFADACRSFAARWHDRIARARGRGGVAVWGGAGKGVTFVGLVDPDASLVDAVVDIHPAKEGKFVPGTGHPIMGPARARALGVRTVIVVNDRYAAEVEARCRADGWDADVWRASL